MRKPCGTYCEATTCSGFIICNGCNDTWEVACGEDAMQCRVSEISEEVKIDPDEIYVFRFEDEFDNEAR